MCALRAAGIAYSTSLHSSHPPRLSLLARSCFCVPPLCCADQFTAWSGGNFAASSGVADLATGLYTFPSTPSSSGYASGWLFFNREPVSLPSDASYAMSSWATYFRMAPPDSQECSFFSAMTPGNRRCRFTWTGLNTLLDPMKATVHVDVRNDVCADAPAAGAGQPLTAADAAFAVPTLALWMESTYASYLSSPVMCRSNSDCAAYANTVCYDLDAEIGIRSGRGSDLSGSRMPNPFYALAHGRFSPAGSSRDICRSADGFLSTIRNAALRALGRAPDNVAELKMCIPDISTISSRASKFADIVYESGATCTKGGPCMDLTAAKPPVPRSAPARISFFSAPTEPALYASIASAGSAPAVVATLPTAPGSPPPFVFSITLKGFTNITFTNALVARTITAIVAALSVKGITVSSSAIRLTALASMTVSGRRLQLDRALSASSGVALTFSIDTAQLTAPAGITASAALTSQLVASSDTTSAINMLPAALVTAGVVTTPADVITPGTTGTPTAAGPSSDSNAAVIGGAAAGGVVVIALIVVGVLYLMRRSASPPLAKTAPAPSEVAVGGENPMPRAGASFTARNAYAAAKVEL